MNLYIAAESFATTELYFYNMDANINTTGKRIRYLRETVNNWNGMKFREELKKMTGEDIKPSTLTNHEKDTSMPAYKTIVNYAKVLGTTTDFLLLATDDPAPTKPNDRNVVIEARGEEERRILEEIASLLEETATGDLRFVLDIVRRVSVVSTRSNRLVYDEEQARVTEVEQIIKTVLDLIEQIGGKSARENTIAQLERSMPATPAYKAMFRRLRAQDKN